MPNEPQTVEITNAAGKVPAPRPALCFQPEGHHYVQQLDREGKPSDYAFCRKCGAPLELRRTW